MAEQSTKKLSFSQNPLKYIQTPKSHNEIYDIQVQNEQSDFQNLIQCLKDQKNLKDKILNEREQSQAGEWDTHFNNRSDQKKQIQIQNCKQNDGDLNDNVNSFQSQENQKQNNTQEIQQENKCTNNHFQFDLGNNADKIEEQIINTKGFKAKKQPTLIKNMKKWRIKQSSKNKSLNQEEQLLNQQHIKQLCDTTKQIVNIQDNNLNKLKPQAETSDSNLTKFITKIQKYQKDNFNNHTSQINKQQQHAEKSISPIDSSKEDSIQDNKNNILSEIENEIQKPEIINSAVKCIDQYKAQYQNMNGRILQGQQSNRNSFQLIKHTFLQDKNLVRNQSTIQIMQKNQQSKMSSNSTARNIEQAINSSSSTQSNAETYIKNDRSQSLNNKFSKKRNISVQMQNSNNPFKGNQSQNIVQEYLQNYLNTADTNHLLLSNLNKGIIQPPPQAQQPETLFIPKVMTRNASFLKKGNNPTENINYFQNSSHQFSKQSDSKYYQNKTNCKENASVPQSPQLNKQNHEVFQFNPSNTSSSQRGLQNSQNFNFQKSLKSYLFYQNKFMGQKQHEFLMNNFKCLPKLNSLINQPQSNMNNESNNQIINNLNKGLMSKLNQSQSEKFIQNKQIEQPQNQLHQDVSPKRVLVCSFTNQYSCQQQQIQKLNVLKQKETIKENDVNADETSLRQVTQESQQGNFNELSNYYKLKYEQELKNKNEISNQLNNQKTQKLDNIHNRIIRKKNQSQDLKYSFNEHEEAKFSELFKSPTYFNEEEIDLLKPWNIN